MFDELNRLAGWKLDNLPLKKIIFISSENIDGSFLLNHFLTFFLKADIHVTFLTAAQSFPHYNVVCSRLGANLERSQTLGKLKVFNLLEASLNAYTETRAEGESLATAFEHNSAKLLYQEIKNSLIPEQPNVVILDDFSVLLHLGFSEKDLITFVHYMKVLCNTLKFSFVTHFQKDFVSESHGLYFYRNFQHYASYEINIRGLDSGFCKEVHGDLMLHIKSEMDKKIDTKQMQYKLTDRTLHLFAPGTSAAVL